MPDVREKIKKLLNSVGFHNFQSYQAIIENEDFDYLFSEINKILAPATLNFGEKAEIKVIFQKLQNLSTEQFHIPNNIDLLLEELKKKIYENFPLLDQVRNLIHNNTPEPFHRLLNESSLSYCRGDQGNRFSEDLKKLCMFIYIQGGRSIYDSLSLISPIPSTEDIKKSLYNIYPYVNQGKIYAKELKEFLMARNLPMTVGICEDGTRAKRFIKYDKQSSSIIGLKPPLNDSNGMPITSIFKINKPSDIIEKIKKFSQALFLEIIIAVPFELGL